MAAELYHITGLFSTISERLARATSIACSLFSVQACTARAHTYIGLSL